MKPYFIYKGKNSREMGISLLKLPPRTKPERRGELITVPGRDGFLFESEDAYNGKTLEIECTFLPPSGKSQTEIDALIQEILVWLDGSGNLIFSDYPNYYYDATIINAIPIERLFKRYRRFMIAFEVQPFAKSITSTVLPVVVADEQVIDVVSFYDTHPKIYLEASGDIEIHINDTIMHFTDLESPIVIDSELMNVTDEVGTNMNNHMVGDFPVLTPGENTISILCEEPSEFIQMNIEYRSLWL